MYIVTVAFTFETIFRRYFEISFELPQPINRSRSHLPTSLNFLSKKGLDFMYLQYLAELLSNETSQSARLGSPSSNQGQPHQDTIGPNYLWNRIRIIILVHFYKYHFYISVLDT